MDRTNIRKIFLVFILVFCTLFTGTKYITATEADSASSQEDLESTEDPVADVKNSVIEVQSGISLSNGTFYVMKSGCGCLVSNDSEGVFVVTANHIVNITEKEKKRFCKKKKIKKDNFSITTSVRLVIKGDITTEVSVLAGSNNEDFCVLDASDVLQEKETVSLASAKDMKVGDTVYALGFPDKGKNNNNIQYSAEEVQIHTGQIQDSAAFIDGKKYLQHSAVTTPAYSGGPLVTTDGYLVGINNASVVDENVDIFYAFPVDEIRKVLDNFGTFYNSREREAAYIGLHKTYEKCKELTEAKGYKGETQEVLAAVIQEVDASMEDTHISLEEIQNIQKKLDDARNQLVKKLPKIKVVIIVSGIILLIVFAVFIRLLIWKLKHKKSVVSGSQAQTAPAYENVQQQTASVSSQQNNNYNERRIQQGNSNKNNVIKNNTQATAVMDGDGTVILRNYAGSAPNINVGRNAFDKHKKYARMLQIRTRQTFMINKADFIIGKSEEAADYAVKDNSVISRQHASIKWNKDNYYIYDLNSVNGTFVNGKKIDGTGTKLSAHDKVVLANETFEFIEE